MKRFRWSILAIFTVFTIGTIGYILLGRGQYSLLNAIYMVVITITTVGFGEIIDLSANPGGRIFTMFIALAGIGALTYTLTNLTAYIVEGDIKDSFRRRRMEKRISKLKNHYIVCGVDQVGNQVLNELKATKRECVVVDIDIAEFQKEDASNSLKDQLYRQLHILVL